MISRQLILALRMELAVLFHPYVVRVVVVVRTSIHDMALLFKVITGDRRDGRFIITDASFGPKPLCVRVFCPLIGALGWYRCFVDKNAPLSQLRDEFAMSTGRPAARMSIACYPGQWVDLEKTPADVSRLRHVTQRLH